MYNSYSGLKKTREEQYRNRWLSYILYFFKQTFFLRNENHCAGDKLQGKKTNIGQYLKEAAKKTALIMNYMLPSSSYQTKG